MKHLFVLVYFSRMWFMTNETDQMATVYLFGSVSLNLRDLCFSQIQIWLAMAYEANNRHSDCIALYQQLEKKHPSISIRRQAAELRYILQAPKLKISQDEMVTIPLIGSSYDR